MPEEIRLANAIEKYGAFSVFGRSMSALEIQRIGIAENIVNICVIRGKAVNAAVWETDHPEHAKLFKRAMKLAMDMGLIDG